MRLIKRHLGIQYSSQYSNVRIPINLYNIIIGNSQHYYGDADKDKGSKKSSEIFKTKP